MKLVYNSILPPGPYKAMTLGPFIFLKKGVRLSTVDVNHEAIHWEQQKELLVIFFLVLYGLMMLWELVWCIFQKQRGADPDGRYRPLWKRAYKNVTFEREAYAHQKNLTYIATRRRYAWLKE